MKGILGKKLGMTQLFDPETGSVTPVTVIEAGPCPVVTVRTEAEDGYEAVQLAFDAGRERKLSKAELGHLKQGRASTRTGTSSSSAARPSSTSGETVTVETFEPGDKVKVAGIGDRQGLRGHDQAAQLQPRPDERTARTTSASRARSARRRRRRASSRACAWPAGWAASASRRSA